MNEKYCNEFLNFLNPYGYVECLNCGAEYGNGFQPERCTEVIK